MYGDADGPIGRAHAGCDWAMFGLYIRNNIGIAFQCFASGLFFGVGSLFVLASQRRVAGSVAGYLTWRGFGDELLSRSSSPTARSSSRRSCSPARPGSCSAMRCSCPAGARAGRARGRGAARVVIVYGMTAMLVVAAALEAFWSSARWVPAAVKYGVGAACWLAVFAYFAFQGRPRRGGRRMKVDAIRRDLRPRAHVRGGRPRRAPRLGRDAALGLGLLRRRSTRSSLLRRRRGARDRRGCRCSC